MELYQLEQLLAIAEAGTISKAAENLHISQPGLTRSIQRLEDELNLTLFDRKKNRVTLNDNGLLAVECAKKVLEEKNNMILQLQRYDRSKRTINIGSCAPAPIWGLTSIFHKLYPEMKITDEITGQKELIQGLQNHQYSIIVLDYPIEDEQYICLELFKENLYISVPPAHPIALFKETTFSELDGENILLLSRIGLWYDICLKMLPQSHLLLQEDDSVFDVLTKSSALPNFKTNITLQLKDEENNRISIPITDKEATVQFYVIFNKNNKNLFSSISNEINHIDWSKVK